MASYRNELAGLAQADVTVHGIRLHDIFGGRGPLVGLLPGFPETRVAWRRAIIGIGRCACGLWHTRGTTSPNSTHANSLVRCEASAMPHHGRGQQPAV